jgi:hypothetical protein
MSEERDLEKELKEEKDRYEQQNQEAYDEQTKANEELRRIQEERQRRAEIRTKKKQRLNRRKQIEAANKRREEFEQEEREFYRKQDPNAKIFNRDGQEVADDGSIIVDDSPVTGPVIEPKEGDVDVDVFGNPRLAASIGTEIGLNLLLDIFSAAPPVQAVGSAWINYLAQKIRGEKDINKLEMTAASIASQIPILGSFKGATKAGKFARGVAEGAVTGAIEETGYSLGRGEEVNLPEAIAFGATTAGIFNARNAPDAFKAIKSKIETGSDALLNELSVAVQKQSPLLAQGGGINLGTPRKGGFDDEAERRIAKIQKDLRVEKGDQLGLFTNEGDEFLYQKYKAQNKVIGTPLPKRQQAGRALRPSDFDDIIEEYPEITPDLIFAYIESTKAGRFGKGVRNPDTGRFKRNNRGLEGTLKFLNTKAAPDPDFDLSEIAAELSAEFNKTITPKTLSNIIDENVRQGTFTFKTQGMSEPIEIKSIDDLRKAYMGRVARYRGIPAFERGHVFAADNIIKDNKIKNLTDFKNNLEPEIARSIYAQLDDQALEELIKANVDGDFSNVESFYKQILAGNRSRKNLDDPDKVIAALYGRDYGLRESFLNFVFPNRSLNRLIPPDLKASFTELYKKELEMRLLDYKGLTIGPAALDKIRADVAQDVLKSFPDVDTRFVLEQMTVASDKAYLKDMVDEATGEAK